MGLPRSLLYAPAHRGDLVRKALAGEADAVIADLEDAVPPAAKPAARAALAELLTDDAWEGELWVRVDPAALHDDLAVAMHPRVTGIVLAKCDDVTLPAAIAGMEALESARGARLRLIGLIESARAIARIDSIAGSPRLTTLGLGEVDLLADLRISAGASHAVDALRLQVIVHARAHGLEAPIAPTSLEITDVGVVEASTRSLADFGFRSRTAVHPRQLAAIHAALTPTAAEVRRARELIEASADGEARVADDGRLVDEAVLRAARETIERATAET